jgi:hypothetical protein
MTKKKITNYKCHLLSYVRLIMHKLVFISVFLHNIKVNFYALIFATRGAIKKKNNCNGSIFSQSMYLVCRKKMLI